MQMHLYNKILLIFLLLVLLCGVQCKKKSNTNTNSSTPPPSGSGTQENGKFEFKANGTPYKFNNMVGAYENLPPSGPVLQISASGNTGYQALGGIPNFTAVETNSITSGFSLTFYFNNIAYGIVPGSSMYAGSHGTIQVTELKTINGKRYAKGIFSGVAYRNASDSLVITEGIFQDKNF